MALGSLFGFVFACGLFLWAVASGTDNYMLFASGNSLAMVLGGSLASAYVAYRARYVNLALRIILRLASKYQHDRSYINSEVGQMIRWAYKAKKEGVIALEKDISSLNDGFLSYAMTLLVSNYEADEFKEMLEDYYESEYDRTIVPIDILKYLAGSAPAFGMIGTLVGLIIMLDNLGGDASAIGQGLAVALLTTLYGVFLARLVFLPAALKAQQAAGISRFRNAVLTQGFVMLLGDASPRMIQDRLNSNLDKHIRYDLDTQGKG